MDNPDYTRHACARAHTHTHCHTHLPFTTFHLCDAGVHLRWSGRWRRLWRANLGGCLKAWCHHLRWSCKIKREIYNLRAYLCPNSAAQDLGMTPRILIHVVNVSTIKAEAHLSQSGGKVVSPMYRPPLPTRKYSWYSFLLEAESTPWP